MRSRPSGTDPELVRSAWVTVAAIAAAALLVLAVGVCRGEAQELPAVLERGQPAPVPGLLMGEEQAKRAVEEIRDARVLAAQVETLKAALAARERENAQLQEAVAKASAALELAGKVQEVSDKVIARYEQALRLADASLERSGKALDRADRRIDSLESQQKWMLFGGVLALGVGFLLGAF